MIGQMSIFDFVQPMESIFNPLEELALHGTGLHGGMKRVFNYFSDNHTIQEKSKFLRKEYGISGFSSLIRKPCYIHSMCTYGSTKKNIVFEYFDENMNDIQSECSWEELAMVITQMIEKGTYVCKED